MMMLPTRSRGGGDHLHHTRVLRCLRDVCQELSVFVQACYTHLHHPQSLLEETTNNNNTTTTKKTQDDDKPPSIKKRKVDDSAFTIADAIVQNILCSDVLSQWNLKDIVGEEDISEINLIKRPYSIEDLQVPENLSIVLDSVRENVKSIMKKHNFQENPVDLKTITAFVDPIDGTREFVEGLGNQCTVLVGFAEEEVAVSGIVYRPLEGTWAIGCEHERFFESKLRTNSSKSSSQDQSKTLVSTNGRMSPFLEGLAKEGNYLRSYQGGIGNKILTILEAPGTVYISDRGCSRWDTCAPEAILRAANESFLFKLFDFLDEKSQSMNTYRYTSTRQVNPDFPGPGIVKLTKHNIADSSKLSSDNSLIFAADPSELKPYANCCGIIAVNAIDMKEQLDIIKKSASVLKTKGIFPEYE